MSLNAIPAGTTAVAIAPPLTEGQVIQTSVNAAQGWVNSNTGSAVKGATAAAVQVGNALTNVEKGLTGAVSNGAKFADGFATSLGNGVEQFVAGTLQVIEAKVEKAVDGFVETNVKRLEHIPIIGDLMSGLIEKAGKALEGFAAHAITSAGSFIQKEIYSNIASAEAKIGPVVEQLAKSVEGSVVTAIDSLIKPLEQSATGTIQDIGTRVQDFGDKSLQDVGNGAAQALGSFAK